MKRAVAFVLVVLALAAGLWYSQRRREPDRVSGIVEADDVRVGSRVGGRVAGVLVAEGEEVRAGAVLVEFEAYDLVERKEQASALLAQRRSALAQLEAGFRAEEIAQAKAHRDQLASRLARLEAGPRAEEIAQARARRDQLAARLDLLRNGARPEDVAAARSQVELAQAELEAAQSSYQRTETLAARSAMSREELEAATQKLKVARSTVDVRKEELAKLERGTRPEEIAEAEARLEEAAQALALLEAGYRKEEVEEARALLEEAEQAWLLRKNGYRAEEIEGAKAAAEAASAELRAIERQLEELRVRAPMDGVVEAVELQPGDLVAPNAPVLSLLDLRTLRVRAYVPEDRMGVEVGSEVEVTVDSYPGEVFRGRVSFLARQAEFKPGNVQTPEKRSEQVFRIRVAFEEGLERLRPGMSADVWLEGPERDR